MYNNWEAIIMNDMGLVRDTIIMEQMLHDWQVEYKSTVNWDCMCLFVH